MTHTYKNGDIPKTLYAFRCDICGAQTVFCETTLELREKHWDRGIYSIKNSEAILIRKSALHEICHRIGNQKCNLNCAKCPLEVVRELRRIW